MIDKQYFILDEYDYKIIEAELESYGKESVVMIAAADTSLRSIKSVKKVHFRLAKNYAEVYEGEVEAVKNGRVYIKNVKNLSAEKREDVKVDVHYHGWITPILKEGEEGPAKRIHIEAKDISCGGICFYTEGKCDPHDVFEAIIPITVDPMIVRIEIVRKQMDEEYGMFLCGAKFLNLRAAEERNLRAAIFKKETQVRRSRNLPS